MAHRILVVDDDKNIVKLVRAYLEQAGFHVLAAYDGETALHIIRRERPSLVVLDLMLPDRNGWDITRIVRGDPALKGTFIIMLTARVDDVDKVVGLELGADDYVTKPFNPREVVARVHSVLRRAYTGGQRPAQKVLQCGRLILDTERREVMRWLLWDNYSFTLDSHIKNLRKKIEPDPANPVYVQTVYGVGYRLIGPVDEPSLDTAEPGV